MPIRIHCCLLLAIVRSILTVHTYRLGINAIIFEIVIQTTAHAYYCWLLGWPMVSNKSGHQWWWTEDLKDDTYRLSVYRHIALSTKNNLVSCFSPNRFLLHIIDSLRPWEESQVSAKRNRKEERDIARSIFDNRHSPYFIHRTKRTYSAVLIRSTTKSDRLDLLGIRSQRDTYIEASRT